MLFRVEFECRGLRALGWHHTSNMEAFTLEELITIYFDVLHLAATQFTPETLEVFCGLKHFTHPSIGTVVKR